MIYYFYVWFGFGFLTCLRILLDMYQFKDESPKLPLWVPFTFIIGGPVGLIIRKVTLGSFLSNEK